jgi:hypothetical protein
MGMTWITGALFSEAGYQPRHRSPRQAGNGGDRHASVVQDDLSWPDCEPAPSRSCAGRGEVDSGQDFLDQLTFGEIRRILEGCALDDPTTVVPELVPLVAHSSHTPATLARAWGEFEEATREAYALHVRIRDWSAFFGQGEVRSHPSDGAVALLKGSADDAWRTITQGPLGVSAPA